jgi:hypothetical protein
MACDEVPRGPHERKTTVSKPMKAADAAKADAFMKAMDAWRRSVTEWDIYINGAAPYWVGPRPKRPGAAPVPPTIENTACDAARNQPGGYNKIFADLQTALAATFKCSGNCPRGEECRQVFTRQRATGVGYKAHMTYCDFTVRGGCSCK